MGGRKLALRDELQLRLGAVGAKQEGAVRDLNRAGELQEQKLEG